ncbi:MAG: hypothetical protein V1731_01955 [Candidatus Aenigmatarchaeota archaeon]
MSVKNLKGDISIFSDITFLIVLFFVSVAVLLTLSIVKMTTGNVVIVTIQGYLMGFSLNTENLLLSSLEVTTADGTPFKQLLSYAAFEWNGPGGDNNLNSTWVGNKSYDVGNEWKRIFAGYNLDGYQYVFEIRKEFADGKKSYVIANNTENSKRMLEPQVAEIVYKIPFKPCEQCSDEVSFRLYTTLKEFLR